MNPTTTPISCSRADGRSAGEPTMGRQVRPIQRTRQGSVGRVASLVSRVLSRGLQNDGSSAHRAQDNRNCQRNRRFT
jgi:hypothetical protein